MPASPEDRALVAACLADRPGAWESLSAQASPRLRPAARRILARYGLPSGESETSDLVQEVFSELLLRDRAALRQFTGRASLHTYLCTIAVHRAQRLSRTRPLPDEAAETLPAPSAPPALEDSERSAALRRAIGQLAPREALALRLELDEAPAGEIARTIGVTVPHLRVLLHRARLRLGEILRKNPSFL